MSTYTPNERMGVSLHLSEDADTGTILRASAAEGFGDVIKILTIGGLVVLLYTTLPKKFIGKVERKVSAFTGG